MGIYVTSPPYNELVEALKAVAEAGVPDIHGFTHDMHHAEHAARLVRKVLNL